MSHLLRAFAALCLLTAFWPTGGAAEVRGKTRTTRPDVELVVTVAATGLGGQLAIVTDRDEQIRLLRAFAASSRFFPEHNGYFFVYDTQGVCVAHGSNPALVGRSLMDYQDGNGFPVIRTIIELGMAGGGFLEYQWEKPDAAGPHEKLGYVMPIPGTDFIIGSGLYLPEIE